MFIASTDVDGDEATFGNAAIEFLMPATLITNITLSILIAGRLIYAHRILSTVQSDNNSSEKGGRAGPYLTALAICVESSAIVWGIALICYTVLFLPVNHCGGPSPYQPVVLMSQLCVSDFLLYSTWVVT